MRELCYLNKVTEKIRDLEKHLQSSSFENLMRAREKNGGEARKERKGHHWHGKNYGSICILKTYSLNIILFSFLIL